MWFLNTETYSLEEHYSREVPKYAILSHTWQEEEVSYQDMRDSSGGYQSRAGYRKIRTCCDLAAAQEISYAWVDTCCIDKLHSAELSEAINSMYSYYHSARKCLIYLADFRAVESSRWFTRGWTLQELIASSVREFYAEDWSLIRVDREFTTFIAKVTDIDFHLPQDRELLSRYRTATRMSWASKRRTTRPEDMAYCLMGIFNISMPILYGEGPKKAFQRLQMRS
ncbi:hypothetical protein EV127DRAFT_495217 [Xylaria flabelliformis]|nr:hypothetical protein EV127DRAFT_495217 [Xylaria flabelliformis]